METLPVKIAQNRVRTKPGQIYFPGPAATNLWMKLEK
jgi:hypothetical protein